MSEWFSVLLVFWALWAVDGLRFLPRRVFTVIGGREQFRRKQSRKTDGDTAPSPCSTGGPASNPRRGRRGSMTRSAKFTFSEYQKSGHARVRYSRLSLPGWWPTRWRMTVSDVPLALSPVGICNLPVGAAGRPVEKPFAERAWRWEEIRQVGVARGWIFVNGEGFCADTGHVKAAELLALAGMEPLKRQARIETLIRLWFRPAHLRRRASVLQARTAVAAWLNAITFAGIGGVTVYVVGDFAARLPSGWSEQLGAALPALLLGLLVTHVAAVVLAWRAKRHLRGVVAEKRGAALFSALLLPPQAFRLRSLLADGFFPPQHPVAATLAFAGANERKEYVFNAVADFRWPTGQPVLSAAAAETMMWFRKRLETLMSNYLISAGIPLETLLAPPEADSPASRSFCPRCRAQFVDQRPLCPHGVALQPLTPAAPSAVQT